MKKICYNLLQVIVLGGFLMMTACDSLIEVNPRQSIDAGTALNSRETVSAAVSNIYSYLKSVNLYGRNLLPTAEALADNVRIINRAGGRYNNEGANALNAHIGGWNTYYAAINECNLVLKALPNLNADEAFKTGIEGQVKALRALYYFNLMRIYAYDPKVAVTAVNKGGVPLLLSGVNDITQITYPARETIDNVYTQIYADLTDAVAKAPTTGGPNLMTQAAAQALFSVVALYNEDFTNAVNYATQALASTAVRFSTKDEYIAGWRLASHPESVFEVLYKIASENIGVNESIQSAYSTRVSLTTNALGGWGAIVPTTAFLNLMDAADVRKSLYQTGILRSGVTATECTKFLGKTGTLYMDNVPVIRSSELYLIRAEANARGGLDEAKAREDVNKIRVRAGLTEVDATLSGTALVNEILLQRRIELAFEGQRWFDLKRLGRDVVKTTTIAYTDARILAPIPNSEILVNPNLVQNAGY
jgi:hypothetical protein